MYIETINLCGDVVPPLLVLSNLSFLFLFVVLFMGSIEGKVSYCFLIWGKLTLKETVKQKHMSDFVATFIMSERLPVLGSEAVACNPPASVSEAGHHQAQSRGGK